MAWPSTCSTSKPRGRPATSRPNLFLTDLSIIAWSRSVRLRLPGGACLLELGAAGRLVHELGFGRQAVVPALGLRQRRTGVEGRAVSFGAARRGPVGRHGQPG